MLSSLPLTQLSSGLIQTKKRNKLIFYPSFMNSHWLEFFCPTKQSRHRVISSIDTTLIHTRSRSFMEPGGRHSPNSLRPTECSTSTIRQEFSSSRSTIDTNLDCVVQSLAIHTVDSIIIWHRDLVLWPILNNNNQVRPHPPPSQLNNNFNWELYICTKLIKAMC